MLKRLIPLSLFVAMSLQACLILPPSSVTPMGPLRSTLEDEDFDSDYDPEFEEDYAEDVEPALPVRPRATPDAPPNDASSPKEVTAEKVLVSPGKPVMELGESVKLLAEVRLSDGQINGNVFWSSSDDRIAKVNPTTGEVTALREGRVTVVASYALDTNAKGLAELTIVKDKSQLATKNDAAAPPPEIPRPEVPPSLVGAQPSQPDTLLVPDGNQNVFSGVAGVPRIIGPLFLNQGIHELRVKHAGPGVFQATIYTSDGSLGDNLYADVGPFDVSFAYMIFNPGWYYVAVENASGDWSITKL